MGEPTGDALRPRLARHEGLDAHAARHAQEPKEALRQELQATMRSAPSLLLPPSLSCCLARAASCSCLLSPVRPRSRRRSPALTQRAARRSDPLDKLKYKRGRQNKNLVQTAALPLSRAASPSLSLLCCLSLVRPLSRRRQAPMAEGLDTREGRARSTGRDHARRGGEGAPGAHGGRYGDDGTLLCFARAAARAEGAAGGAAMVAE